MKKYIYILLSLLIFLGNAPISEVLAEEDIETIEFIEPASYPGHIKRVSITVYIGAGDYPPGYSTTYYYNDGYYSGTLRDITLERRPGGNIIFKYEWYATYSGNVVNYGAYPTDSIELSLEE